MQRKNANLQYRDGFGNRKPERSIELHPTICDNVANADIGNYNA